MNLPGRLSMPRWMVGCLIVGAFLRLFRISHQSLWIDELISLQLATYAEGAAFWRGLLIDIHGPFVSTLLHGWTRLGEGEGWLRLLFVIPSLATIPIFHRFVTELVDEKAGRLAAWMLAVSPFHVWYAQEVRAYAWAMLWAVCALWLFVRLWDGRAGRGTKVALTVTLALGVLTNFSLGFLLAALSVAVVARRPFSRSLFLSWSGVAVCVALVFLPWFVDWFGRIGAERIFVNAPSPLGVPLREDSGFSPTEVPYAAWSFVYGYSLGPSLRSLHLDRSPATLARYAPVFLLGFGALTGAAVVGVRELWGRRRGVLVGTLVLVPLLLCVLLAARGIKTFHPRYLTAVYPVALAVLAVGWTRSRGRLLLASAAVAAALTATSLGNYYFNPEHGKDDSRAAARLIAAREEPGDSVVVIYSLRPFRHYFSDTGTGQARLIGTHKRFLRTDQELRAHAESAADGAGRVWLVLTRWWDVAPEPRIRAAFESILDERERWEFPGVKVTLYDRRSA